MGELARMYWFPLYAYLRRNGNAPPQAEDLVQGFFVRLLEKDALASVDRSKGKFRSFLLASLKNFLANEWDKSQAQKRGGGKKVLALDALDAEARYAAEPVDELTPERVFERRWALAVLEQVLMRLREEYAGRGQGAIFAELEQVLVGGQAASHAQIAERLGMTEGRGQSCRPSPEAPVSGASAGGNRPDGVGTGPWWTRKSGSCWRACNLSGRLLL